MALRPMREIRAIGNANENSEITNPFFIPILLSPVGSSFELVDTDPQLRIENSAVSAPTDILAKLMFVYINHTRRLVANDGGVDISI
jgi:hypothetical protein